MSIDIVWAPTNLGLRPPEPGAVPGTVKAPEALREAGLGAALGPSAGDAGTVLAGRYRPAPGAGEAIRNERAILAHTRALADRVEAVLDRGRTPLVVGGDCSLVLGPLLALRRGGARIGLVYVDGHGDFRRPATSDAADTLGGEALAAAVGLHHEQVSSPDGLAPLVRPVDAVQAGYRDDAAELAELRDTLGDVLTADDLAASEPSAAARRIRSVVDAAGLDGFWIHVDVDVLDPRWMPAVDSPDPGGLEPAGLAALLAELAPHAIGADLAIYDPELDPDGSAATIIVEVVRTGLAGLGSLRRSAAERRAAPASPPPPGTSRAS
ncbi:arginase family protein [Agromyces sp. G08B096]|uniref:Arginase family protein n=1 Tax=Agromyces sp. G08B096 TaxID=3156399 RepID=A0AAU7W9I9_9MICO